MKAHPFSVPSLFPWPLRPALAALVLATAAGAQGFDPPVAPDMDPDPDVVEVHLVARETTWQYLPGVDTTVWAYNDTVPGPTIVAKVGDTLRVRFTNELPEATTIHWHGMETPASMDGSHIAQLHVQPGETFVYEFPLLRAALTWYHPHVRPFDQVEKGLYGAVLVKDPAQEQQLGFDAIEEHVVVFDDVLLDANHQVVPAFSFTDPLKNAEYQLNGREGNLLLVNGREASTVSLTVPNGLPQRWRVLNAANSTFCRLNLHDPDEGFTAQLWELGTDGGYEEHPYLRHPIVPFGPPPVRHPTFALIGPMSEGILLLPGERLDVLFTPIGGDGERFRTYQHDWIRGRHIAQYGSGSQVQLIDDPFDGLNPKQPYFEVVLSGPDPGLGEYVPPEILTTIPLPPTASKGVLPVTFGHGNPDPQGNITLFAQADFSGGTMTPLPTAKIDSFNALDVDVGDVWTWEIQNLTHGDHPFHSHGFFFLPLQYEFQDDLDPAGNFFFNVKRRLIKDTIRCPARGAAKGTSRTFTRLLVYFDETGREGEVAAQGQEPTFDVAGDYVSGGWLFHCHVLEHSGRGMLSFYEVHEPDETFTLLGKHLAGTNGNPYLSARGDLSPGSAVEVDLVNALPNHPVVLIVGKHANRLPYAGGEIVPSLEVAFRGVTDAQGAYTWSLTGWDSLPAGTELYLQAGFSDPDARPWPGARGGPAHFSGGPPPADTYQGALGLPKSGAVALSNALTFTRP